MKMPCKECLVKAICIQKVSGKDETVTGLECPILNKWLITHNGSSAYGTNLVDAYRELRSSERLKGLIKFIEREKLQ